jgi:DNA-binding beta-propeller fold protein YncE
MHKLTFMVAFLCASAMSMALSSGARAADSTVRYVSTKTIPLGAPDRWDYLAFEDATQRVFVAHESAIDVINGKTGASVGKVAVPGANGMAVVSSAGKGYAGSRASNSVLVFDLASYKVTKKLPADEDTDGVVYDPASKRVFVMEGDPAKLLVIDTATDTVASKISLSGKPEYSVVDGVGNLYVNIADKRQIQRIDTATAKVTATWPIPDCESPHGLSMDVTSHRLFASCINSKLLVVSAEDGHVVATLPIGMGTDATAFDTNRKRAFSSNWDGTLSVIGSQSPDHYVSLGEITTRPTARTMAVDSQSGRIYLVAAERIEVDPAATNPRKRYGVKPGSVSLIFMDPTP